MKLTLIRGLPGSGKSTLAKEIGCLHIEADMFFMDNGVYNFNPEKIKEAHKWCQDTTREALKYVDVVVSNTFSQIWEMQPYLDMDADITVITATGDYANTHNVPNYVIRNMKERWEDIEILGNYCS